MSIQGVIFDLDGVITDTAEYHYQAWKNLAQKLDIEMDREFNEQLKGISRLDSLDRILAHGHQENTFTEAEKNVLATEKNQAYVELIQTITPADILPGIQDLIDEIKGKNIKMALASASKNGMLILRQLQLEDAFDEIVDPSLLAKGKPDPEIFLTGAKQLQLSPSECIGIEDAQAGIEAINRAGMFSVGVGDVTSMKDADYYVTSTKELSMNQILQKVNQKNTK